MPAQKGNIALIILGIVAILALAAAGYLFWRNQNLKHYLSRTSDGSYIVIDPIDAFPDLQENKTPDETENWKTFANEFYSLNYPTGWNLDTDKDGWISNTTISNPTKSESLRIYIDPVSNSNSKPTGNPEPSKTESAVLDGVSITKNYYDYTSDPIMHINFSKNGYDYVLGSTSKTNNFDIANQILSTFKFTN